MTRALRGAAAALSLLFAAHGAWAAVPGNCNADPGVDPIAYSITATTTYCELCGTGQIDLVITNPYGVDMTGLVIRQDLLASGLTYVPGTSSFTPALAVTPVVSGANDSIITWDLGSYLLLGPTHPTPTHQQLELTFNVRSYTSATLHEEDLAAAARNIQASLTYQLSNAHGSDCDLSPRNGTTGPLELPIHQPVPQTIKTGRNADAGQTTYAATVYGNTNDDVIWQIQINNSGPVALQDLILGDTMLAGNYTINYLCPTAAAADAIAADHEVPLGPRDGCVYYPGGITTFNGFIVEDPFGAAGTPVDVAAYGTSSLYLVGKVNSSCVNRTNTAENVAWGCVADGPTGGGITQPASTGGVVPTYSTTATANLNTLVNTGTGLTVATTYTGTDGGGAVGSKGVVTITITNGSGGTVKNIHLRDLLPPQYVVDPTFTPTIATTYANQAAYPGMVDTVTWDNPVPGTVPLSTTDPSLPLGNTAPEFSLTSSTTHPIYGDQVNVLRNGDRVVITFRIILVDPAYFDKVADLDVQVESPTSTPPGTDPAAMPTLTNRLYVDYVEFCTGASHHNPAYPITTTFTPNVEDLDVDINGTVFILTNTEVLPLRVDLTNRGGHSAADWTLYVSFGYTMDVVTVPGGCTLLTAYPPPLAVWRQPSPIPSNAHIYECRGGAIGAGATRYFNFGVQKSTNPAAIAADDLTFRADVVGQIMLSNNVGPRGQALWFPTPDTTVINNTSNNYSLDGIRARVIGFNLLKSEVGNCSEENSPVPALPDSRVIIGEECTFHVDTGGWFGFQTPGFTYIAVQNIRVEDQVPAGQAFLRQITPPLPSTPLIQDVNFTAPTPPAEGAIAWTFNPPALPITTHDQWFRMNVMTRITNNPDDPAYGATTAPNYHSSLSRNLLVSTFDAVFRDTSGTDIVYPLGPGTVGYPQALVRQVDLTITEPRVVVTKEVCDETLHGVGTACSSFAPTSINEGDANHSFVYRITVTNSSGATPEYAPAYDVASVDTLDASDLMRILPFESDGLDNDGDGLIDGADPDGEGAISDNVVNNGVPAQITFDSRFNSALRRMAPGATVRFYYRVDPDDTVAPLQSLVNTVATTYDSLLGDYGNQSSSQRPTGDPAGARLYHAPAASATVQIVPVQTQPKTVTRLSNTALGGNPQSVSIGEEVEYQLSTYLPVALLRSFTIRDVLPTGMRCIEAPAVNLDAAPYNAAGFVPGGTITPTCSGNTVQWNFGNQRITHGDGANRFNFQIRFIARVDNSAGNNNGTYLRNGSPTTTAAATYVNESGSLVTYNYSQFSARVREPHIALTKTFAVTNSDAADEVTVTVTARNDGTATAYNLQVFDDLDAVGNLIFLSGVGGLDPPDVVDTATFGGNRPLFRWTAANPRFAIATGATVSFTFRVRVLGDVQPLKVFANTAQASWTSLPGSTTALNSSGSIGADGSVTGMRNGAIPPAGNAINDYESSAAANMSVPALTVTKSDLSTTTPPVPGAHKHFQIQIRLPEGTSHNVRISDNLALGSVGYVLENNVDYDVTYSFDGITTINGAAPGEAAFLAFPADGTTGTAVWNIGTVVTASEDDLVTHAITPTIRIDYHARVNNDLVTDAGDTLQNSATLNYRNGQSGATESITATAPAVTVLEPLLTLTKGWTNVTTGKAPGDAPDGGDLLQFTVTVQNSGGSTAFDINLVDTLSAELAFEGSFTPTATIAGVPVTGFLPVPTGAPGGPLVWGRSRGDTSLDLPAGQSLVLIYRARVGSTVEPRTVLTNSILADWTSLDGTSVYERDGAGCPTITAPNDYCSAPAQTTITVADNNSIAKSITADTWADAPLSTATDAIMRVGDTVTYRLAIQLQEGRTRDVNVRDALPTGMTFVDIVSVNGDTTPDYTPPASGAGSNFSYAALTAANRPAAGQTGTVVWNFGPVINDPTGDATTDTLVILYRVRVTPDAGIPHVPQTTLTNTATLSYLEADGSASPPAGRLASQATATVRQPVISTITKTDRSGRLSGDSVNVALDVMNFRVAACNTAGLAPAYSVLLSDTLATQLNEASLAGPVNGPGAPDVRINGVLGTAGTDYVYTPPAGRGGTWSLRLNTPVNPGQCVYVDYDIGFHSDVGSNQAWQNSALLSEYWSLANLSGQRYGPVGPVHFSMNSVWPPMPPPAKSLFSPASGEATIGTEVVYRIAVPNVNARAALYDVVVTDTLDPSLRYLSAHDVSGHGFTVIDNSVAPNLVNLRINFIPAGQQAVIELHARVDNNTQANAGHAFSNQAFYSYSNEAGGATINGGTGTATPLLIVEPSVTAAKTVQNLTRPGLAPDAGDVLRYTLTVTAGGGAAADNYSNAFDLAFTEALGLGLAYHGNVTVTGTGNTAGVPVTTGDGVTTAQTLRWNPSAGNANVNVAEGQAITFTYEVVVLDPVRPSQNLTSNTTLQWTSLSGAFAYERDGSATPAYNDYVTTAANSITSAETTTVTKRRLDDSYLKTGDLRIGDVVQYELRIHLDEGTRVSSAITDTLPQGLRFDRVYSINGDTTAPYSASAPFTYANIAVPTVTGDPHTGPTTVVWNVGDLVNAGDNVTTNDDFVIVYLATVADQSLAHVNDTTLTNSATLGYTGGAGAATRTGTLDVRVHQPQLVVAKSAAPAGGDTVIDAGELITYTVNVTNTGTAPAYDLLLRDVLPVGLRQAGVTTLSTTFVVAGTVLPNVTPVYSATTGIAEWNFDTGVANAYTIAPGETLRVVYRVQADAGLSPGLLLVNGAVAQRYYSFDNQAVPGLYGVSGVREVYGPSNTATVTLTTAAPHPLAKQNPAVTTAAVGAPFTYRITVPATPQATALHDVRIIDDLTLSAASLSFVSVTRVSGSRPWTPVNTGTAKQIVIEDTVNGIEIPAGEQVVIDLTVVLDDVPANVSGLLFHNTASYTYNTMDGDASTRALGGGATTPDMTIVGADSMTVEKGGPATMQVTAPGTFTLNAHNTGTGRAWDLTLTDILPNPNPGGMCNTAPDNVTARVYQTDGTTPVSAPLVAGADFGVSFSGEPACTLAITMRTAAASIGPGERLIVSYRAYLDGDNLNGVALTNVAGATQWFSADTAGSGATGSIRTYTRTLTNGTPGTLDHQDAHTVTTQTAVLLFQKTVRNQTTGQDPGANATPGDTLRYRVTVRNLSNFAVTDFAVRDELDRLNASAMFVPGSLMLVTVPAGGDTSLTSGTGGVRGSGLVDVAHLNLGAAGGGSDTLLLEFDARLAPAITNATVVLDQAQIISATLHTQNSDDPTVNGADDPQVFGDEDPTPTRITSAPAFRVQKISQDMTGDPAVLMAGDVLRYTITVKNIGTENATGVTLRDPLPPNTTYVASSTRLNGTLVADPTAGVSALQAGMLIHAPEDATAGAMRADATATVANVATITFDVRVDPTVVNGTVISNQGFVTGNGAGSGPFPERPSDDPDTPIPDDPTRDVVGNVPLVDAQKTVAIVVDNGTPGIVDPGDVLRYTITITNSGGIQATGVTLIDAVPANTQYVANSTTINGLPAGQPDGGVSPLAAGLAVSSSDRTPPLPAAGAGILSAHGTATVIFDVQVNAAAAAGTLISNQGSVRVDGVPAEPTDADGNDANGDQPTVVVVGSVQQLSITKQVAVVGGGAAVPGAQLDYTVRVTNIGSLPATNVVITDDLNPLAGLAAYVAGSGTLNGSAVGVSYAGGIVTADYAGNYGTLPAGGVALLRFQVTINAAVALGTTITNTARVVWSSPARSATATVSVDVGGTPGSADLNGRVWHDGNLNRVAENAELKLANWSVDIYRGAVLLGSAVTDTAGLYRITGLAPDTYELRFRAPGAGANTAAMGYADSAYTNSPQRISAIAAGSGSNLLNLNLPVQPDGVIYNAVLRSAVAGATVNLVRPNSGALVPATCFDDPRQQGQVTTANGYYKFDINFSDPGCAPGNYLIQVTPPAGAYLSGPSRTIPPTTTSLTPAFNVPLCPGGVDDAVPATADRCEIQVSEFAPGTGIAAASAGTRHMLHLSLDNVSVPRGSQAYNNHIPVDPRLENGYVAITKTAARVNVSRGDMVPYTITFRNISAAALRNLYLGDMMPAGFKYVEKSARLDGVKAEPTREGLVLVWQSPVLEPNVQHQLDLLLIVGSGVSEGEYVNRARMFNAQFGGVATADAWASPEAQATVRVVPDPTFDCTDIIGKVFDDVNVNGLQDEGEPGLAGVRIISARGLIMTTDEYGRYHITCAAVPNEDRGSNFILKLDDRSLPTGYRVTTENPLVQRATRGKMMKFNFGAALHRVVNLGLQDGVFEPGTTEVRVQWQPRIAAVITELRKSPSVLRLSYMADVEAPTLVEQRLAAIKQAITGKWREAECCRELAIESEVVWRRGAPPEKGGAP